MRLQQEQRQREISLMAYQGASSSFISPPPLNPSECIFFILSFSKLKKKGSKNDWK